MNKQSNILGLAYLSILLLLIGCESSIQAQRKQPQTTSDFCSAILDTCEETSEEESEEESEKCLADTCSTDLFADNQAMCDGKNYVLCGYDEDGCYREQARSTCPGECSDGSCVATSTMPAFPGAEGFGAYTSGGRGGEVYYVTNLEDDGVGSLKYGLASVDTPRYILFKSSGYIPYHIQTDSPLKSNFYLAGQTSPGGIITRMLKFDAPPLGSANRTSDVIIRHMRFRPDAEDAMRIEALQDAIIDHSSLAWQCDEVMEIKNAQRLTVQNSILGEKIPGCHKVTRGGMLMGKFQAETPLTEVSVHHNYWPRVAGRLPETGCYQLANPRPWCHGHVYKFEFSNNLYWDIEKHLWFTHQFEDDQDIAWGYHLNWINNYARVAPEFSNWSFMGSSISFSLQNDLPGAPLSKVYFSGNEMSTHPGFSDWDLVDGSNLEPPSNYLERATSEALAERNPFPEISYTDTTDLYGYMIANVGAFPRDPMDRRFIGYVENDHIDPTPNDEKPAEDGHLFDWTTAPVPPLDSDNDGMPDFWEIHHGLNPLTQDHNGKELSVLYTGIEGYDNLECYLNQLSDHYVSGKPINVGEAKPKALSATKATATYNSGSRTVMIEVTYASDDFVSSVDVGVDALLRPFDYAQTDLRAATSEGEGRFTFSLTLPASPASGDYEVLLRGQSSSGETSWTTLSVSIP